MPGGEMLTRVLAAAEAAAPVDAVSAVTREIGIRLGATTVSFLIVDMSGRALVRLAHAPSDPGTTARPNLPPVGGRTDGEDQASLVPYDNGPLEQVIRSQHVQVLAPPRGASDPCGWRVLAPVTERGDAIGVLELCLPAEPDGEDLSEIASLAHLLAFVVVANRRHTDLFEWGQRSRSLSLSAEIQQRLLPGARACEGGSFTLAGWLEPAADIAGDTFDYSLGRHGLWLSMTDAMGHGVGAALTATLCVGALRGARRDGMSLTEQAAGANTALIDHGTRRGLDDFVTGLLGYVELGSGMLHLVNAGHVAPYLLRGTEVRTLSLPVNLPFGMLPDTAYTSHTVQLQEGDRLVCVTDGMVERGAADIDLPRAIRDASALHPREAVAALADSVLEATQHALTDDATVLCLDWYGNHGADRVADEGADESRASNALR